MGLSRDASQRGVQTHIVTLAVLLVASLATVAVPIFRHTLRYPDGTGPDLARQLPEFQAVMGVLAAVVSLRLLWLVRKHRSDITRVHSVRGMYYQAGVATMALAIPGMLCWWPTTAGVAGVGALATVATACVPRIPKDERVWPSDFRGI